jgi:FMN reductase
VLAEGGYETRLIDLAMLPAEALLGRNHEMEVDDAIMVVGEARIVVAASPTYRALYTGLTKCFFDLMPAGHLAGKVCVPVQTGASPIHFLAVEYGLRPLFMSLDGVPLAGIYATDEEFLDGRPSEDLAERVVGVVEMAMEVSISGEG